MNGNDKVLEAVISTIDNVDSFEMSITLNVKGILITGMLVSKTTFLKSVASSFEGKGEIADVFSDMFLKLAEYSKEETTEETEDEIKPIFSVHLRDAKIFYGDSIYNIGYWRGKLSSVDGFNFGTLERQ